MDWSPDWKLRGRMVLALALLVVLAVAFVGVVTGLLAFVAQLFGLPVVVAPVAALALLVGIAVLELHQRDHVVREAGAVEVDAEAAPRLHRVTTSVAQQADVQVPTLAVADTETPEAFTAGFRPSTTTLAASTGLLDELDDRELRAVVAHELAHVKNRDVAVMTAVSLPTAVAERLRDFAEDDGGQVVRGRYRPSNDDDNLVQWVLVAVGGLFGSLGRFIVASLSRTREVAADRGAVAITGDPASLASALDRIEGRMDEYPTDDLRAHESVMAFSIVSPDSTEIGLATDEPIRLGPDGGRLHRRSRFDKLTDRFLRTHPPVAERRERLKRLAHEG